jgi:hypothetical protein
MLTLAIHQMKLLSTNIEAVAAGLRPYSRGVREQYAPVRMQQNNRQVYAVQCSTRCCVREFLQVIPSQRGFRRRTGLMAAVRAGHFNGR